MNNLWQLSCSGLQGQVLALDIQEEMLSITRGKVQAEGLSNVQTIQASMGDGKLPSAHFDYAVLVTVLVRFQIRL